MMHFIAYVCLFVFCLVFLLYLVSMLLCLKHFEVALLLNGAIQTCLASFQRFWPYLTVFISSWNVFTCDGSLDFLFSFGFTFRQHGREVLKLSRKAWTPRAVTCQLRQLVIDHVIESKNPELLNWFLLTHVCKNELLTL